MRVAVATVFCALIMFANCTIPDYIHVCQHDDTNLAGCIKKSIEMLRPRMKSGIPELEIPSIEPFNLDIVSFATSSQATKLATNVTNIHVYGASDFEIIKINPTLTKNRSEFIFEVVIPHMHIEGDYQVDSKILLLQLQGNGPFNANISDFHFQCKLKGQLVQREEVNHMEFAPMTCNVVIGGISIILKNLFNGNAVLEEATNHVINDNSNAFFEEIRPNLIGALAQKFTDIANKITLYFTYEELFP